ncbi:MAG: hypothetical protein R3B57_01650 [Phycisphaerales bacterium]
MKSTPHHARLIERVSSLLARHVAHQNRLHEFALANGVSLDSALVLPLLDVDSALLLYVFKAHSGAHTMALGFVTLDGDHVSEESLVEVHDHARLLAAWWRLLDHSKTPSGSPCQ